MSGEPELIDVAEIARRLRISQRQVYQLVSEKSLPVLRVGRRLRFIWSDVLAALRGAETE